MFHLWSTIQSMVNPKNMIVVLIIRTLHAALITAMSSVNNVSMGDHIDQMIRDSEAISESLAGALLAMPDNLACTRTVVVLKLLLQ